MQFSWNFCYNVIRKNSHAIKCTKLDLIEDMEAGLVSNDTAGWNEEHILVVKVF